VGILNPNSIFHFSPVLLEGGRSPYLHKMPALDPEEDNNTTTRLLTLLNVSALKSSKRKRTESIEPTPRVKLNRRRSIQPDTTESTPAASGEDEGRPGVSPTGATRVEDAPTVAEDVEDDQGMFVPSWT